ncbi:hypothetical protein TSTA_017270 [Talaromyces stipitatus ATCC 10500]|uniref:Uncharacterized protein n=1 Tax=Talaromyces stipitatus (strain ATCC 10500 / CBS 375.48 / QM 6759 / NRRL 1006) TaxID=441959 RepID=B8MFB8_TALSN|nr:uncharacterized protein TSTA_017270 [Talaromyces stipitatus ATCC 10500]EED16652.1 hypothetical protein TSTA_017270 [Talaromyces stipitatus ATCC 10500]
MEQVGPEDYLSGSVISSGVKSTGNSAPTPIGFIRNQIQEEWERGWKTSKNGSHLWRIDRNLPAVRTQRIPYDKNYGRRSGLHLTISRTCWEEDLKVSKRHHRDFKAGRRRAADRVPGMLATIGHDEALNSSLCNGLMYIDIDKD